MDSFNERQQLRRQFSHESGKTALTRAKEEYYNRGYVYLILLLETYNMNLPNEMARLFIRVQIGMYIRLYTYN